jgi:MSHA pilin protein MshC
MGANFYRQDAKGAKDAKKSILEFPLLPLLPLVLPLRPLRPSRLCGEKSLRTAQPGFTLPELVAVLLLIGILSASAMPKLQGVLSFRDGGWRDQVVAALHYAHKSAVSRRRLVCADVGAAGVTLSIASANPATGCSTSLPGLDGQVLAADAKGGGAASITPSGTIYFQPSGRASTDGAGSNAPSRTISIAGQAAIVLVGETGHVE